jgi:thiazole synthase ThiGH ThiG subunit
MIDDELAQRLHDEATRGAPLSTEDRDRMEQWYVRQDEEESRLLERASQPTDFAALKDQVDAALAQILTVTQRIQILTAGNDILRREIADLHRQLAEKAAAQPA